MQAADAAAAAAAVCGIQAQDLRAQGLALRSRTPGLTRADVHGAGLLRTWSWRGTVHLHAREDVPWVHALCVPRMHPRFERLIDARGQLRTVRRMAADIEAVLSERPLTRAQLLQSLARRGHPDLGPRAINVLMPWAALSGLASGLADGRFTAPPPSVTVDEEEALALLGRRYLAGYGPASAHDLAAWSGLGLTVARRALDMAAPLERIGDLRALPGTLDAPPPPVAAVSLLAAFDTALLGYASRDWIVPPENAAAVMPGGGMLRATVLARGRAVGTWRVAGSGRRRSVEANWFGRPPAAAALRREAEDVVRFLGSPA